MLERISKLEEDIKGLTSVADKGFDRVIRDSENALEDKLRKTLQLSLATFKSDILLAIAKEELRATEKND
ncbi:hypothetical protein HOY82DRAFT_602156 [Tuber indicum]|nr:hypothetical protein HOY82DRAFT_602156 [Tuber indicum]